MLCPSTHWGAHLALSAWHPGIQAGCFRSLKTGTQINEEAAGNFLISSQAALLSRSLSLKRDSRSVRATHSWPPLGYFVFFKSMKSAKFIPRDINRFKQFQRLKRTVCFLVYYNGHGASKNIAGACFIVWHVLVLSAVIWWPLSLSSHILAEWFRPDVVILRPAGHIWSVRSILN